MIEIEDDVDLEMSGQGTKANGDFGMKDKVDDDPDCEVLRVERATRRDPEHRLGRYKVP